jgi:hypothetical protein
VPVRLALDDARQKVPKGDDVRLLSWTPVEWPDSSLGCPQPGFMYLQVVTSGYRVQIAVGGTTLTYHTDSRARVVLCN